MSARYISFKAPLLAAIEKAIRADVNITAMQVVSDAKRNASGRPGPKVQTGTLRGGIHMIPAMNNSLYAVVVSSANYSLYVELGTRNMSAYPFFCPALDKNRAGHSKRIKKIVGGR